MHICRPAGIILLAICVRSSNPVGCCDRPQVPATADTRCNDSRCAIEEAAADLLPSPWDRS